MSQRPLLHLGSEDSTASGGNSDERYGSMATSRAPSSPYSSSAALEASSNAISRANLMPNSTSNSSLNLPSSPRRKHSDAPEPEVVAAASAAAAARTTGTSSSPLPSPTSQQRRWGSLNRGSSFAYPSVTQEESDRLFQQYNEEYERIDWARGWHSSREEAAGRASSSWRLMNRSADFGQSTGSLRMARLNRSAALYFADLWHTLVDSSLRVVFLVFILLYLLAILVFTFIYMMMSEACQLDLATFGAAWAFSLETIMTIGYAFPGKGDYFTQCWPLVVSVTLESILGVICDSVCVGLVFARLSRAQTRAATIVFSDCAVMRRIHGKLSIMFQVAEMRKHQLVEAHVRCYAVSRHRCADSSPLFYFRSDMMRLVKPDDELGGMLFMAFPNVIVHNIDHFSPLQPPPIHQSSMGFIKQPNPSKENIFPGVIQRDCDVENGSRDLVHDPDHPSVIVGNQEIEPKIPPSIVPGSASAEAAQRAYAAEEEKIKKYLMEHRVEIICLVEGIDAVTSDTIQARHSYCFEDIMWHFDFVPCLLEDEDGAAQLDFEQFHKVFPVPEPYKNLPPMYLFSCP